MDLVLVGFTLVPLEYDAYHLPQKHNNRLRYDDELHLFAQTIIIWQRDRIAVPPSFVKPKPTDQAKEYKLPL